MAPAKQVRGWHTHAQISGIHQPQGAEQQRILQSALCADPPLGAQSSLIRDCVMNKEQQLQDLLTSLRDATKTRTLISGVVTRAINKLKEIDVAYVYDLSLFPRLPKNTSSWNPVVGNEPSSLAEALLWKMGKWKVYRQFCKYYAESSAKSKGTDVVFYAFARHLKYNSNPIYDQHALRALWCIDEGMSDEEREICKGLLFVKPREKVKDVQWKSILAGAEAENGYRIYCERLGVLCGDGGSPTPDELDKLLMPLGQAIKQLIGAKQCLEILMPPGNGAHSEKISKNVICAYCQDKEATTVVETWDTWHRTQSKLPACSDCALKNRQTHLT